MDDRDVSELVENDRGMAHILRTPLQGMKKPTIDGLMHDHKTGVSEFFLLDWISMSVKIHEFFEKL